MNDDVTITDSVVAVQAVNLELLSKKIRIAEHDFVEVAVVNDSKDTFTMGEEYYFDYLDGHQWIRIDLSRDKDGTAIVFNALAQELLPGQKIVRKYNLWKELHAYQAGTYRVMVPVRSSDKPMVWLTAEFQME